MRRNHKKINQTVDMGYNAVEKLEKEIRDFLQAGGPSCIGHHEADHHDIVIGGYY